MMLRKLATLAVALGLTAVSLCAHASAPTPTGLTATVNGSNVTFNWVKPASGQGENLFCAATPAALAALPNTLAGGVPTVNGSGMPAWPATSYTLTNVASGTQSCAITVWDCTASPCTESAQSNAVTFTVGGSAPIALTNGTASITWIAPTSNTDGSAITGAVTYNVYQGASAATLAKVTSAPLAALADTISGLAAGSTDCFAVTALVAGVESAQTTAVCGTVPAAVILTPSPPSSLKLTISLTN